MKIPRVNLRQGLTDNGTHALGGHLGEQVAVELFTKKTTKW